MHMIHLLLVQQNTTDRSQVEAMLSTWRDATITVANQFEDATEQTFRHPFDLVIADICAEANGLNDLRTFKSFHPNTPVIAILSETGTLSPANLLRAGADNLMLPSPTLAHLDETISRTLETAQRQQQQRAVQGMVTRQHFELTLPSLRKQVGGVARWLVQRGIDSGVLLDEDRPRIGVSLDEALINAVVHGNLEVSSRLRTREDDSFDRLCRLREQKRPYCDRVVNIICETTAESVMYQIEDQGKGFDIASLPDPTTPVNIERPSGRGILMMRTFMDEVTYNSTGNRVTLIKNRDHAVEVQQPPAEDSALEVAPQL